MILDEIVAHKRIEVECRREESPASELRDRLRDAPPPRGFRARLARRGSPDPAAGDLSSPAIIAEIKKGSPSRGVIRFDFDPAAIARAYEDNGAAALSVLTDRRFFYGCLRDLQRARAACSLPILRKDFVVEEYQILEARAAGADAVLLIAAVLRRRELERLLAFAREIGLDALVEVHDAREMEIALNACAELIGVNNRDLQSFRVDIAGSQALYSLCPDSVTLVAESGIKTAAELRALARAGVHGALVGETLMSAPDPGAKLRELLS